MTAQNAAAEQTAARAVDTHSSQSSAIPSECVCYSFESLAAEEQRLERLRL